MRRNNMIGIYLYISISVLLGCISCFFGKKFYFPILMLTVFASVVAAGFTTFGFTWKVGVISVLVGGVAALLSKFFYKLGVFLLGGVLGAASGLMLASFLPPVVEKYHWAVVAALALVLAMCAVKWCDLFIITSTAYNGASLIATPILFMVIEFRNLNNFVYADGMLSTMANLNQYLGSAFSEHNAPYLLIGTLIVAVAGFIVQFMSDRKST